MFKVSIYTHIHTYCQQRRLFYLPPGQLWSQCTLAESGSHWKENREKGHKGVKMWVMPWWLINLKLCDFEHIMHHYLLTDITGKQSILRINRCLCDSPSSQLENLLTKGRGDCLGNLFGNNVFIIKETLTLYIWNSLLLQLCRNRCLEFNNDPGFVDSRRTTLTN